MENKKVWTVRVAGAGLGAVLLAGLGLSTASAAQGGQADGQVKAAGITRVTNVTPSPMTLCSTGVDYAVAPPQTVASGDTASWTAIGGANQTITSYCFPNPTDASQTDKVNIVDELSSGERETASSKAEIQAVQDNSLKVQTGVNYATFIGGHPQTGDPHHFDIAVDGATLHIDAAKDPAAAAEALTHMDLSDAAFGGPRFTFEAGQTPTFHYAKGEQAGAKVINESSAPAKIVKGHETSMGESTSVDGEASASLSAEVFGLAVKAAVSSGQGQEWASSDSMKTTEDADIAPHHEGSLTKNLNIASLTGEIAFTSAPTQIAAVNYDFSNMVISRSGIVDPSYPVPPVNFSATQQPISTP